jgi:glycerol kinase
MQVIVALDLGTTGNRAMAFANDGRIVASAYQEFPQHFPKPGWVEHDPMDIWRTAKQTLDEVLAQVGAEHVVAIGLTNQRETTILWDRTTGTPVYNAIVWQCRRTQPMCERLKDAAASIKQKTGLFFDPYFSATKIAWILEHVPGVRAKAEQGQVIFGTVDTWILWQLTGGRVHATETSNASRTLCYNIHTLDYDDELLRLFGVPRRCLPEVKESAGLFGHTAPEVVGREIPITGILGDQQAALFAQGGWESGVVKNTYGTGLFVMRSTGAQVMEAGRLVSTIGWTLNGQVTYALEGSIFVGGSCIQWLRDGLRVITSAEETEAMAQSLASNDGVYFVPALVGLGAPYWDPSARGLLVGLTRGTTPAHLARAALESMAYQTRDVVEEMNRLTGQPLTALRVDGGAVRNDFLMQFQADLLNAVVERPAVTETTALGAAGIAGLAAAFWTQADFLKTRQVERSFTPGMDAAQREAIYGQWKAAVEKSLGWATTDITDKNIHR